MREIEKILEELEEKKKKCLDIVKIEIDPVEITIHREQYKGMRMAEDIIRKHANDGWIPVEERLPKYKERCGNDDNGNQYMKRLEIAYMTDTVEYTHGYYDGYKWMDKYHDTIKNVVAWRIHEPYQAERSDNHDGE